MELPAKNIYTYHDHEIGIYTRQSRYDPTRTLTLRNTFVRQMNKRFRKIRGIIRKAIVDDDCFGLNKDRSHVVVQVQFDFPRSQEKVNAFMDWLKRQEDANIIETIRIPQIGRPTEAAWTDTYIRDSYKRGVIRARNELKNAGYDVPGLQETGGIEASMSGPFHADRVGLLYTRTFNGLKGITDAMDNQISQVLAQGLADGDNPRLLAKKLTSTISGPLGDLGITDTLGRFIPAERRAQTLARTEVIRAHHQATVQEYKNWAAEGVKVKAEWVTAGHNVCPECAMLEGRVFTLTEIENMIPVHPNCRCVAIPLDVTKEG